MDLTTLIAELGLPIALVVYFIWRDSKRSREDRKDKQAMTERIQEVEDYQKTQLQDLTVKSNTVMMKISESNEQLVESNKDVRDRLLKRPCLKDHV